MMRRDPIDATESTAGSTGRWLVIAAAIIILCSCRAVDTQLARAPQPSEPPSTWAAGPSQAAAAETANKPTENPHTALARHSLSDQAAATSTDQPSAVIPTGHTAAATSVVLPADGAMLRQPLLTAVPQTMVQASPMPRAGSYLVAAQPTCPTEMVYPAPMPAPCYGPQYAAPCQPQMPCQAEPWCPCGVPCGPWTPPGLPCPWPEDEYLCDGGDKRPAVQVNKDWSVDGLALEDTVVHYDTIEGDTFVEPSNRVCIYSPRFASVRKVYGIVQHDYLDRIAGVNVPVPIEGLGDVQIATTKVQPLQPGLNLGTSAASGIRENTPPIGLENQEGLIGTHASVIPYEDFNDIRRAMLDNSEKARLAELIQAAVAWSHDAAVQVVIDNIATHEEVSVASAGELHIYSLEGKPRLRVCKLASRSEARPGETVEFTLQFENVGDQVIGNVTVIDNLTTRLEYVEGSQTCSLNANFSVTQNEGESLQLRWEITEPMKATEGGVIRFTCRVR